MKISVAMATFNGSRYLTAQLESIAKQTVLPDEIIITDDRSDDSTLAIAESFARSAPCHVKVFQNDTRLGSRKNFIRAISLCRNEIVAMCDQDDVWLPSKLERTSGHFVDPDVMATIHSVTVVDEWLRPLGGNTCKQSHFRGVQEPLTINPWYSPYGMSMLIRKELYTWVDPQELYTYEERTMGHDMWGWFLASVLGKIVGLRDRLVLYRQHESNLFGAPKSGADSGRLFNRSNVTGARHYYRFAERAAQYSAHLERVSPGAPQIIQERAKAGIQHFRKLADYLYSRATFYTSRERQRKGQLLMELALSGAYKSAQRGGLGHRAFVKDVYTGLVRNRVIA